MLLRRKHIIKQIAVVERLGMPKWGGRLFEAEGTSGMKVLPREAACDFPGTERRPGWCGSSAENLKHVTRNGLRSRNVVSSTQSNEAFFPSSFSMQWKVFDGF